MTTTNNTGPIEVWLSQSNMIVECRVVREDETTYGLDIDSLSIRGAQREITGHLLEQGYKPDGRWQDELNERDGFECWRRFRAPA